MEVLVIKWWQLPRLRLKESQKIYRQQNLVSNFSYINGPFLSFFDCKPSSKILYLNLRLIFSNLEDKMKLHVRSLSLHFWECLHFEALFRSLLLNLYLFLFLHTNPKFHKVLNLLLLRQRKYRHQDLIHFKFSNFFMPRMPFYQPYFQLNQQLWL